MQTPSVTLKLRRFRRRFGIAAPKVVVKSHLPWHWFAVPAVLLLLLVGAVGWMVAQRNEAGELGREVGELREQLHAQREELNLLRSAVGTGKNAVSIERASQQQLISKIKGLEAQNALLKEDILLFERLIPVVGEVASLRVEGFRVSAERQGVFRYRLLLAFQPDKQNVEFRGRLQLLLKEDILLFERLIPVVGEIASLRVEGFRVSAERQGVFRYRLLLAFQPDKQNVEFRGRLQLLLNYSLMGKRFELALPEKRGGGAEYHVEIKRFLRREGVFELPDGAVLESAEAVVLQGDTLIARRLADL